MCSYITYSPAIKISCAKVNNLPVQIVSYVKWAWLKPFVLYLGAARVCSSLEDNKQYFNKRANVRIQQDYNKHLCN